MPATRKQGIPPVRHRRRARRSPHRIMAEPRQIFRPEEKRVVLAKVAAMANGRGFVHTELRSAISRSDARKCGSERHAAARARFSDPRTDSRQRRWRRLRLFIHGTQRLAALVCARHGFRPLQKHISVRRESFCRRHEQNRRYDRGWRGEYGDLARIYSRNRRLCSIRFIPQPAQKCR